MAQLRITLLTNAAATGTGQFLISGGVFNFTVDASVWNGAQVSLEFSRDDSTYIPTDISLTQNGSQMGIPLEYGYYRAAISGSPTGVNASIGQSY
jgi:hypothetical protein